jgi:hypothetical protein
VEVTLGEWRLRLGADGKVESLVLEGRGELLAQTDYRFDLGDGRAFVPAGWDECFPTIEAAEESGAMGDLVGCAPQVFVGEGTATQMWVMERYVARREFRLKGDGTLEAEFSVENTGKAALRFLWASHALFAVEGLLEVELPDGKVLSDFTADGTCEKWFVKSGEAVVMRHEGFEIYLKTDQPYWGIWFNRGGWPAGRPAGLCSIGIEATNTNAERPRGARIAAGGAFGGWVVIGAAAQNGKSAGRA